MFNENNTETKMDGEHDNGKNSRLWSSKMWNDMSHDCAKWMIWVPIVCCVIATVAAVVATMYLGSIVKLLRRFVYMCAYFDRATCWI